MTIPEWLFDLRGGVQRPRWLTVGRDVYVTNGHLMLWARRVPWLASSPWSRLSMKRLAIREEITQSLSLRGLVRALPRSERPLKNAWEHEADVKVRPLRHLVVNSRYIAVVERLYPGCTWLVPRGRGRSRQSRGEPARAVLGGRVVAVVMPMLEGGR